MSTDLPQALENPAAWPFPVERVEHLQTHISHVYLVGDFAYKVKKPVDFGFLDFTTLERRRFFCEEEVRLNGRMAPGLYLAAVPITRKGEGYQVEGEGEPVEYAVKMRRFDQDRLLDRLPLTEAMVDALAERVAAFHQALPPADSDSPYGEPRQVWAPMEQNFEQIRELGLFPELEERLTALQTRARQTWEGVRQRLAQRKAEGFIRECHGDMHLGNMAWVDGQVMVFDGIEFNEPFRWIDVANDIAFLLMDLEKRGQQRFARRFLRGYLESTGDFPAVALLPLYKSYRAMVRAKVAALRLAQEGGQAPQLRAEFDDYLDYAEACLAPPGRPLLWITHGVSGSGKSHLGRWLADELGFIHLSSDVERKRLFGLGPRDASASKVGAGIYTAEATEHTYGRLEALADDLLAAGQRVVVDATFPVAAWRRRFAELAARRGACFKVVSLEAPQQVLEARVEERSRRGGDPSEADLAVLADQLARREPLGREEREDALVLDASGPLDWERLEEAVKACR